MTKISIVVPVYNEEKSINLLLQSLCNQSHKPNEILISDGGSTDSTLSIINKFKFTDIKIKVYNRIGKCRGSGRNEGINNSTNDLIALIDAGAYADKFWLEKLLQSFNNSDKNIDIVYGAVKPITNNIFKESIASIIISKSNYKKVIMPTVSSILFKKKIWHDNKFPESKDGEYIVEDLVFLNRLKNFDTKSIKNYNAIVNWEMPSTIKMVFNRFSNLSRGGIKAGFARTWHYGVIRNYCLFILLFFLSFSISQYFLLLLILFIFLRTYSYNKYMLSNPKYLYIKLINKFLITTYLLFIVDAATINGFFRWIYIDKIKKTIL